MLKSVRNRFFEESEEMKSAKTAFVLPVMLALATLVAGCAPEAKIPTTNTGTVIVLMDMQRDYLQPNGRLPIAKSQIEPVIKTANELIDAAREHAIGVVYVRNWYSQFGFIGDLERNYSTIRYWPGAEFDPKIDDTAGVYFNKIYPDAFSVPQFGAHLEAVNCGHLVIAGVHADSSVVATARAAIARGYKVTVISDGIGDDSAAAREDALHELKEAGAQIETSQQFIAGLNTGDQA